MNVAVKNTLIEIKGLLQKEAEKHTPEGSDAEAVVDQWIHALATNSDFYCDNSSYTPQSVKNSICKILEKANYYESTEQFYNLVFEHVSLKPQFKPIFTFIDLFAGIGGIRLGFQKNGGSCVFSSEFEKPAQKTYKENFGEHPFGDITNVPSENIPNHDILLGQGHYWTSTN